MISSNVLLGAGIILFGAVTLRGVAAYVTCHISRIELVDNESILVETLSMPPFAEKRQLVTRHAFHAMGSGAYVFVSISVCYHSLTSAQLSRQ
jgi:hypothetical protein